MKFNQCKTSHDLCEMGIVSQNSDLLIEENEGGLVARTPPLCMCN
jgi:hypothetical protein